MRFVFFSYCLVLVLVSLNCVHNMCCIFFFGWFLPNTTFFMQGDYLTLIAFRALFSLIGHPWRLYSVLLESSTCRYQFCLHTLFVLLFHPVVYFFFLSTRVPKTPLMYCRSFVSYLWLCSRLRLF